MTRKDIDMLQIFNEKSFLEKNTEYKKQQVREKPVWDNAGNKFWQVIKKIWF